MNNNEAFLQISARSPFQSRSGCTLLAADFKQIELRILAHLSGDEKLLKLFHNKCSVDIFTNLASQWLVLPYNIVKYYEFSFQKLKYKKLQLNKKLQLDIFVTYRLEKPKDAINKQDRDQAKRIVYSVMYGAGKERLAEYLKITPTYAKAIMESFLSMRKIVSI